MEAKAEEAEAEEAKAEEAEAEEAKEGAGSGGDALRNGDGALASSNMARRSMVSSEAEATAGVKGAGTMETGAKAGVTEAKKTLT